MKPLKVALMGLGAMDRDYLSAVQLNDDLELVAVAETDRALLRSLAPGKGVRVYEDYRRLIIESAHADLDLLIVAAEPFRSVDFLPLAAQRHVPVFHRSPFARNAAEARGLADRFGTCQTPFFVDRPWTGETALREVAEGTSSLGWVYLAVAYVTTMANASGWRGDSLRAGGGVLLYDAYESMDLLTSTLGLPESVYAQAGLSIEPGASPKHDTEDAALLLLRFSDGRMGSLSVWRQSYGEHSWLSLIGTRGVMDVYTDRIVTRPTRTDPSREHGSKSCSGKGSIESIPASFRPRGLQPTDRHTKTGNGLLQSISRTGTTAAMLQTIGQAIRSKAIPRHVSLTDQLPTMAVMEAAYLSCKTGEPESPKQFLP